MSDRHFGLGACINGQRQPRISNARQYLVSLSLVGSQAVRLLHCHFAAEELDRAFAAVSKGAEVRHRCARSETGLQHSTTRL